MLKGVNKFLNYNNKNNKNKILIRYIFIQQYGCILYCKIICATLTFQK